MPPIDRYAIESGCSDEELLAVTRVYARDVVSEHDLTVSVGDLEWRLSTRAKRRAGMVRYRDGEPRSIVLARRQFENRGWNALAATIRHELVHTHLLNERGDPSHGDAFARLAAELETHVRCERFVDPRWWVRCVDCGDRLARYRRSKLVERPEEYRCGNCGGRFRVVRNE
jgi:predicted SprT family Zn-dependent metalloprotease